MLELVRAAAAESFCESALQTAPELVTVVPRPADAGEADQWAFEAPPEALLDAPPAMIAAAQSGDVLWPPASWGYLLPPGDDGSFSESDFSTAAAAGTFAKLTTFSTDAGGCTVDEVPTEGGRCLGSHVGCQQALGHIAGVFCLDRRACVLAASAGPLPVSARVRLRQGWRMLPCAARSGDWAPASAERCLVEIESAAATAEAVGLRPGAGELAVRRRVFQASLLSEDQLSLAMALDLKMRDVRSVQLDGAWSAADAEKSTSVFGFIFDMARKSNVSAWVVFGIVVLMGKGLNLRRVGAGTIGEALYSLSTTGKLPLRMRPPPPETAKASP